MVEGGPQRDWLAESRLATLAYREQEVILRERRLTIVAYALMFTLALQGVLAVVLMGYGNRRLDAQVSRPAAAGITRTWRSR